MPTIVEDIAAILQEIADLQAHITQDQNDIRTKQQQLAQLYADALANVAIYVNVPVGIAVENAVNGNPYLLIAATATIDAGEGSPTIVTMWTGAGSLIPGTGINYTITVPSGVTIGSGTAVDGQYRINARRSGNQIVLTIDKAFYAGDNANPDFNNKELLGKIVGQFFIDSAATVDLENTAYYQWHAGLIAEIATKTALANDGQLFIDNVADAIEP